MSFHCILILLYHMINYLVLTRIDVQLLILFHENEIRDSRKTKRNIEIKVTQP